MRNVLPILFTLAAALFLYATTVNAQVVNPNRGGTGITTATDGDVGSCLKVLGYNPLSYEFGTCGGGGGGGGDSVFTRSLTGLIYAPTTTDSFAIGSNSTSTAEFWVNPNNATAYIQSFLGIGTTSPSAPLSVAGNSYLGGNVIATGTLTIAGTGTSTFAGGIQVSGQTRLATSLTGFLKATAGVVGTSLVDLSADVTGTLPVGNGGTGLTSYTTGDLLYASGASTLAKLGIGTTGQVLGISGGLPAWVATSTLGLGGGSGGITSLNGQTGATQTFASSSSGADFSVTSSGNTHIWTLPSASASARGLLTSSDWSLFNAKVSSTSIDTSAELASLITDETGSGSLVFSASPTFTGTLTYANQTGTNATSTTLYVASAFRGAGLTDCDTASTSKLLWDATSGQFSCGSDQTGAGGSGITTLNGQTETTQTFASSTSGTDFQVTSSGGVHTFRTPTASATARGFLSSTDWSTFNNKVSSTSLSASFPLSYNSTTGAFSWLGLGTTTTWSAGNLATVVNGNTLSSVATTTLTASSPLSLSQPIAVIGSSPSTLTVQNAAADGSTKGVASFSFLDFDASSGNISIDYTNAQKASASFPGFLTSADWSTFNNKISSTSLNTSDKLANLISDETGNGVVVFSTSPVLSGITTYTSASGTTATATNLFAQNLKVGSLTGFLKATAGVVSTSLIDLTTDVTGILPVANGGTGTSSPVILYKPSAIQVTSGASAITTGDGKAYFRIPKEYNGMNLADVDLALTASSSSDFIEVQISRGRQTSASTPHTWVDILSTRVTIDANELDSRYSATTTVINTSNDDVMEGDLIRIDIDRVPSALSAVLIVQPVFALP